MYHSASLISLRESRGETFVNIPVGTLKIGLLRSDDQTAKDNIAMSIGGAVKASKKQKLAL